MVIVPGKRNQASQIFKYVIYLLVLIFYLGWDLL